MNSTVSVIIPVFNAAATIERAVESVVKQNYPWVELIIIDGASTDQSLELMEKYRKNISAIISEQDKGVYDAINKGLDRATGDWIYILGADDELANETIISSAISAIDGSAQLVYGDVVNTGRISQKIPAVHTSSFGNGLIWKNTLHQQAVFYHSPVFRNYRFDASLKVLADYDLHLKLRNEKSNAKHLGITVAICAAGGLSKSFSKDLYREELSIKKHRLSPLLYLLNIPWVWLKYLYKNA